VRPYRAKELDEKEYTYEENKHGYYERIKTLFILVATRLAELNVHEFNKFCEKYDVPNIGQTITLEELKRGRLKL
jgi:protein associated with RNAse G/E